MAEHSQGRLNKNEGSYYTPARIANIILDIAGYISDGDILASKIIDPSAGDGAILVEVVKRYIGAARAKRWDSSEIAEGIARNIFAYELDFDELEKCKENVCLTARNSGVEISLDNLANFKPGDAFELYRGDVGTFDYVVGNPPYVRIHNLSEKPNSPYVDGMCDLFYPFYDIGQQLLKKGTGVLSYISPSSWFTASAGKNMRHDLYAKNNILAVCDFGHYQVFAPYATAYTAIIKLGASSGDGKIEVYSVDKDSGEISGKQQMPAESCWVQERFLPDAPKWLSEALSATGEITVRNGYATNLDRVYISPRPRFPESSLERGVIKASRCEQHYMIYPYDTEGNLLPFKQIEESSPRVAQLLLSEKDALLKRTQVEENHWWMFARTQGLIDTFNEKVAVQALVKPGERVRCLNAPSGCGVYGGIYVKGMTISELESAMNSPELMAYAAALRKYKSGGYYALGGKDLERFLNWYIRKNEVNHPGLKSRAWMGST